MRTTRWRPADAARERDIPHRIILDAIRRGELRATRLGHRTIILDPADVDRWLASCTTGPEATTT